MPSQGDNSEKHPWPTVRSAHRDRNLDRAIPSLVIATGSVQSAQKGRLRPHPPIEPFP